MIAGGVYVPEAVEVNVGEGDIHRPGYRVRRWRVRRLKSDPISGYDGGVIGL